MKRFIRVTGFTMLIALLFSCFKRKEEPFCVTYKVDGYTDCLYSVNICFVDSKGKQSWVCTTNPHWTKTVKIPKGSCASLVAYPFRSKKLSKCELEKEIFTHDKKVYLSAKIISGDKAVEDEGSTLVSLVLVRE